MNSTPPPFSFLSLSLSLLLSLSSPPSLLSHLQYHLSPLSPPSKQLDKFHRHAAQSVDIQASPTLSCRPPMKNMGNAFEKVDQRKLVTQNVRQCTRRFAKSEQANSMSNVSTRIRVFGWCEILLQLTILCILHFYCTESM